MAIDDVMSDYENDASSDAFISIQPASGDEWMVTHLLSENDVAVLCPHTGDGPYRDGHWGGSTATALDNGAVGQHQLRIMVTNSEYVRWRNGSGTAQMAYSAIKSKD